MTTRSKTGIGTGIGAALLAGAAAYAYFKYSKMSEDEKQKLVGSLKEKGKKFYDEKVPSGLKNIFTKKQSSMNGFTHARV